MKTWRHLYPQIRAFENLALASLRARKGKRWRPEVFAFELRREENLLELQRELDREEWRPGQYRDFYVDEPKRRLVSAAPYRDRIVHHALCNVIEPLFDRTFIDDSFACRRGRGSHAAADRYQAFARRARYALQCDIARYFPSIRHDLLYDALAAKIDDPPTLRLIETIIRSRGDEPGLWLTGRSIPIGNLTSQFFANVYLNRFDHWLKEEVGARFYLRYVDDFIILGDDRSWLHGLIPRLETKLAEFDLLLHARKRQVFPVTEGCTFMGYRIFPGHRRLTRDGVIRARRRLKAAKQWFLRGRITADGLRARIMSWIGHAAHADTWGLRRSILGDPHARRHRSRNALWQCIDST